jgi:hypothetical protein
MLMPLETRTYWGCTTFGCERGFYKSPDLPTEWVYCPSCGGELTSINSVMHTLESVVRSGGQTSDGRPGGGFNGFER